MGRFCLDARIQAKALYHNTNDDSRNHQSEVFMVFVLLLKKVYASDPFLLHLIQLILECQQHVVRIA